MKGCGVYTPSAQELFPFSAVVGMDDMRLALILNAISPGIGGVLVRGEKGTAKSTTVRGLTAVLPSVEVVSGCRFSCLPSAPDRRCPDGPHAHDAETEVRAAGWSNFPSVRATTDSRDHSTWSVHLLRA